MTPTVSSSFSSSDTEGSHSMWTRTVILVKKINIFKISFLWAQFRAELENLTLRSNNIIFELSRVCLLFRISLLFMFTLWKTLRKKMLTPWQRLFSFFLEHKIIFLIRKLFESNFGNHSSLWTKLEENFNPSFLEYSEVGKKDSLKKKVQIANRNASYVLSQKNGKGIFNNPEFIAKNELFLH